MSMTVTSDASARQLVDERDRELLLAVAARDQRALEQLYHLYRRPLRQFLARLQPTRDTVEEAINDAFFVVWRQASRFRGASRVSTWITGIAWRCALRAYRRNNGGGLRGAAWLQMRSAVKALAPEPLALEETDWLSRGLASLPCEQRATLELAYYLGHSCTEIAEIMQCPVNTVKARMFQARIKLRNLLPALGGLDAGISTGADADAQPRGC